MKNHTCNFHIRRDGKSKLKGHRCGFFEKGINYIRVFVSQLLEIGQPMPVNMDFERILHLKIDGNFKT